MVRPSVKARTLVSWPSSRSSMIRRSPAWPKIRRTMIWSMPSRAWRRLSQTKTPLPAARPSALSTRPSGRPSTKSRASAAVLKTRFWPRSSISTCTPGLSISRGSMIRSMASSVSPAVRQWSVWRIVERPRERTISATSRDSDVVLGIGRRAEDPVVGRRDARLPHQVLGEDLAPLQLGGFLPRPEDPQALALEDVDDPLDQRLLRADDRQADAFASWRTGPARGNRRARSRTFCTSSGRARVPGCAEDGRDARRLLQLPAKSVLTPPFADD